MVWLSWFNSGSSYFLRQTQTTNQSAGMTTISAASTLSRRLLQSSRRRWRHASNAWLNASRPSSMMSTNGLDYFVTAPTINRDTQSSRFTQSRCSTPISIADCFPYNQHIRLFSATTTASDNKQGNNKQGNNNKQGVPQNSNDDPPPSSFRDRARAAGDRARAGATRARRVSAKGAKTAGEMMRQYGPVFVGTYFGVYVTTLASLFVGIDSGLLDPLTIFEWISSPGEEETKTTVAFVVEYMEHFSFTRPYSHVIEKNPHFANLAVAWITVKFTEPLRLGVTLAVVPKLARHFGFVKVVKDPNGDEIEVRHDEVEELVEEMERDEKEQNEQVMGSKKEEMGSKK